MRLPTRFLTALSLVALGAPACASHDESGSAPPPPAPAASAPPAAPRKPAPPPEVCNGLDDDGDGAIDEGNVCHAACSDSALASDAARLQLPKPNDITVAPSGGEQPELTAMNRIPEFCTSAVLPSTADDVTVGCGRVLAVDSRGIQAKTLRVAPGGVVRLTHDALLDVQHEILVCPGAVIESGQGIAERGPGAAGSDIELRTERLIMLGTVDTHGGVVPASGSGEGGTSGDVMVHVERLLFAGTIDTAGTASDAFRKGRSGFVGLVATKESFFSGTLRSGNADIHVPVM